MKKITPAALLAVLVLSPLALFADPFGDFNLRARDELIKPAALDLGGLLGAASFYDGRALGFPGFRVDIVGAVQSRPDKNNLIMRDAGVKAFGYPMLEAAIGLPGRVDVVVHGLEANKITQIGGGLRYGILKSGLLTKFMPNLGVAAFGDKVNHAAFKATHFSFNAAASWDLPFVAPFIGAGADLTRLTVGGATTNAAIQGTSATAAGSRFMAGVDLKPFPLARVHAAYMLLHGITGGNFGLGVQF